MRNTRLVAALMGGVSVLATTTAAFAQGAPVLLGTIQLYGDRTTERLDDSTASVAVLEQAALASTGGHRFPRRAEPGRQRPARRF
jgi:hypothetical protein